MGEEATKTEENTVEEKTTVSLGKTTDLKEEDIRDNIEDHNVDQKFEPLFEDESVSDAQLRGEEDDTTGEETATPEPKGDKETPEKKTDEKAEAKKDESADKKSEKTDVEKEAEADLEKRAKEAGKTVEEIKAEDDAAAKKKKPDEKDEQISGLNTALHQERKTIKQLKARVAELEAGLKREDPDRDEKDNEFKDFKVLSNKEYEELLDDDPDEAAKYLYKFNRYQEHQRNIEKDQLDKHRWQTTINELVNDGIEAMEKIIPGITTGKAKEDVEKLSNFAIESGFDNDILAAITDPRTKIVTHKEEAFVLSDGAAQILNAIKLAFDASSFDKDQLRKEIETELRPKIEAEVQKTLIEKLQKDPESGFRSLDMTAGSGLKETQMKTGPISEADYANMSEKERADMLGA